MNIETLPKRDLKTRHYSKDMNERYLKEYDYNIYMDVEKKDLKKLTKGQLIELFMNQQKKPTPPPRTGKPKPVPRKSVKEYEDIIQPPSDGYKPKTERTLQIPKIKELN